MRLHRATLLAALLLVFGIVSRASAADLNGRWRATFGGPDGPELIFTFKAAGEALTGTVESPMGVAEIVKGRIDGGGAAFSFSVPFEGGFIDYKCRTVGEDEIAIDGTGIGDGFSLKATRLKPGQETAQAAAEPAPAPREHVWWKEWRPRQRPYTQDAKKLPLIAVRGNRFVDPEGKTVLFRGLSIADPDKIEMQGHWNRELFEKVKDMGARLVRIPVHPVAWRERTPAGTIRLLDQAVAWCTELDMYVMIDWHSIGNLETGLFQDPMYDTSKQETFGFWRAMARHYAGHNTVAFFELFNEPTTYRDQLGPVEWSTWKRTVELQIALIRAANPQVIPVVAGFDWAYDLTPLRQEPIAAEGIAYATHPYAHKRQQPWAPRWEADFGFAADRYPIIATEFGGFPKAPEPGSTATPQKNAGYGPEIIRYLESRGISWTVWCFDPEWGPTLIKNWDCELNDSGEFARAAMRGELK